MNAVISGSAGVAIVTNGDHLFSINVEEPHVMLAENVASVRWILGGASDLTEMQEVSKEQVVAELTRRWEFDRATRLLIATLDPEQNRPLRRRAAKLLDALLARGDHFGAIVAPASELPMEWFSAASGLARGLEQVGRLFTEISERGARQRSGGAMHASLRSRQLVQPNVTRLAAREPMAQNTHTNGRFPVPPPNPRPPFRRLRTYAFDPSLATQLETAVINEVTLGVRWEDPPPREAPDDPDRGMTKGPVGEYLEVIDFDPASDSFYAPVDLNDPTLLAQDGLAPSEGNPQFHQQMVYAVAMTTIKNFERALGRLALWAPRFVEVAPGDWQSRFVRRLRIYPHAIRQANAYYSPQKKALLFGYFPADASDAASHLPGGTVFTCLSHDVVVHETTHALLDGIHRRYIEASNPDALAFHEAFADVCALFQHFSFPEVLRHQIGKTRGDLGRQNILGELAQQFGRATGNRGALRSAIGGVNPKTGEWEPYKPRAGEYRKTTKPHERGSHLVAAVFDAFVSIYKSRVADLLRIATGGSGVLPEGQLHPDLVDRLSGEAAKASQHVLNMCVRALDYCPPIDPTFGEYLRALITADYDLYRSDEHRYRVAIIEAFRRRGIYPNDLRTLSEDTLRWHEPTPDEAVVLKRLLPNREAFRRLIPNWDLDSDRRQVFTEIQKVQGNFHVSLGERLKGADEEVWRQLGLSRRAQNGKFEVHSMRPARRQGPDGESIVELVVEITQRLPVFFGADGPPGPDGQPMELTEGNLWHREKDYVVLVERPEHIYDADAWFRGGATLLIDPRSAEVRYVIGKGITNRRRLEQQARYASKFGSSLRATYFGAVKRLEESEAFAMLHGDRPEEGDDE